MALKYRHVERGNLKQIDMKGLKLVKDAAHGETLPCTYALDDFIKHVY
jgi:hypothetical protein